MKKILLPVFFAGLCGVSVFAHFQLIYTPSSVVEDVDSIPLILVFTHPADTGYVMDIGKNEAGEVKGFKDIYSIHRDKKMFLTSFLEKIDFYSSENSAETVSAAAYSLNLNTENVLKGGGDWVILAVPHPYYEVRENIYIQQITKTIINKNGMSTDWYKRSAEGFPEIMPLVKPYDVIAGGLFRGVVVDSNGSPVPNAKIEFAYVNYDIDMEENKFIGDAKLENASAGVLFTDHTGVFSFIPPKAGWWGFAAIDVGNEKKYEGKILSQDAVIWIEAFDNAGCYAFENTTGTVDGKGSKVNREFSPAALIIVILLFIVLLAWPPIFKKMTEKKQSDKV